MNMVMSDVSLDRILHLCRDITRENVIKLLLRCKKMYEARVDVKKILQLIIQKEEMFKGNGPILKILFKNEHKKHLNTNDEAALEAGLQMISRVLRIIN